MQHVLNQSDAYLTWRQRETYLIRFTRPMSRAKNKIFWTRYLKMQIIYAFPEASRALRRPRRGHPIDCIPNGGEAQKDRGESAVFPHLNPQPRQIYRISLRLNHSICSSFSLVPRPHSRCQGRPWSSRPTSRPLCPLMTRGWAWNCYY